MSALANNNTMNNTTTEEICAICQTAVDFKKSVLTSCNHYFCSKCFFKWMEKKADCPVCRKVFRQKTNYDIELEREILSELEGQVRNYTNLVEELNEQAFNIDYKKNTLIKACMEIDETLNKKKQEFIKLNNDVVSLHNKKISITNDIKNQINNFNNLKRQTILQMQQKKQKQKRFGMNFKNR